TWRKAPPRAIRFLRCNRLIGGRRFPCATKDRIFAAWNDESMTTPSAPPASSGTASQPAPAPPHPEFSRCRRCSSGTTQTQEDDSMHSDARLLAFAAIIGASVFGSASANADENSYIQTNLV